MNNTDKVPALRKHISQKEGKRHLGGAPGSGYIFAENSRMVRTLSKVRRVEV